MPNQNEPNVTGYIPFDAEIQAALEDGNRAQEKVDEYVRANALRVFEIGAESLRKGVWPEGLSEIMYGYAERKRAYAASIEKLHALLRAKSETAYQSPPETLPGTLHDYLSDE